VAASKVQAASVSRLFLIERQGEIGVHLRKGSIHQIIVFFPLTNAEGSRHADQFIEAASVPDGRYRQ
jgi:hypothetical protein